MHIDNYRFGHIDIAGQSYSNGEDGEHQVEEFRLEPYQRLVADFFSNAIRAIAQSVVSPTWDDTFFHIYFKWVFTSSSMWTR